MGCPSHKSVLFVSVEYFKDGVAKDKVLHTTKLGIDQQSWDGNTVCSVMFIVSKSSQLLCIYIKEPTK